MGFSASKTERKKEKDEKKGVVEDDAGIHGIDAATARPR